MWLNINGTIHSSEGQSLPGPAKAFCQSSWAQSGPRSRLSITVSGIRSHQHPEAWRPLCLSLFAWHLGRALACLRGAGPTCPYLVAPRSYVRLWLKADPLLPGVDLAMSPSPRPRLYLARRYLTLQNILAQHRGQGSVSHTALSH